MPEIPQHKPQEIPLDHPDSCNFFQPNGEKLFLATPAAINTFSYETIIACLQVLQDKARTNQGIDYLQVFEDEIKKVRLWFIEDGPGGAITALLPSEY